MKKLGTVAVHVVTTALVAFLTVMFTGSVVIGQVSGTGSKVLARANTIQIVSGTAFCVEDTAGNDLWCVDDLGTTGRDRVSGNARKTWADGDSYVIAHDGTQALATVADAGTTGRVTANTLGYANWVNESNTFTVLTAGAAAGTIRPGGADGTNLTVSDGTNTIFAVLDIGAQGAMSTNFWRSRTNGDSLTLEDAAGNDFVVIVDGGTTGTVNLDQLQVLAAGGNLPVRESAGNTMATFTDLGTTGRFDINGLQVGCADGRVCDAGSTSSFIELNSGLEIRSIDGQGTIWYENGTEILRLTESGTFPRFDSNAPGPVIFADGADIGANTNMEIDVSQWFTGALDFGAITDCADLTITATGAVTGDQCSVGHAGTLDADLDISCFMTTDTANVRLCCNKSSAGLKTACADPASQGFAVRTFRR